MSESPDAQAPKDEPAAPAAKEEDKAAAPAAAAASAKEKSGKGKDKDKEGKDKAAKGERQTGSQRQSNTGGVFSPMGMAPQPKPTMRFMPTYRLEPKNPLNKEQVEIIMKTVMDKHYNDAYLFHPKHSLHMAAQISEEIKNRIKLMNYDRYRYIVLVTVGECLMQGLYSMVNFLWDAEKDGFVTYKVEQPSYYAICTTFYIYYD
ncbi:dynein light chain Tctex-type protein 2B [Drosophila obscura]|uniref:dynein light chain Tctex-type protein 2B n=1 Tax=Drosophila obscura TaxID=7282 RepID=UPI001BB18BD7|nr:dynein light chain Tctex-type protein 2B [Drosophila obscura]